MELIKFASITLLVLSKQSRASNSPSDGGENIDGFVVVTPDSSPKTSHPYYELEGEPGSEDRTDYAPTLTSSPAPGTDSLTSTRTTHRSKHTSSHARLRHNIGSGDRLLVSEGALVGKGIFVTSGKHPLVTTTPIKIIGMHLDHRDQLLLEYRGLVEEERRQLNWAMEKHQASCFYKLPRFIDEEAVEKTFVVNGQLINKLSDGARVVDGQLVVICSKHGGMDRIAVVSSANGYIKSITQVKSNLISVVITTEQPKTYTSPKPCIVL
jgi:hypothetical protein